MKTAILIHGMPSKEEYYDPQSESPSNAHWFPWVQHQLILQDVLAQTIEMPTPYAPVYAAWESIFRQFAVDKETLLVGYSLGAGFLVRYLSENDVRVGKVILVAPWMDPEKELENGFFDFIFDTRFVQKTQGVTIFISEDDDAEMHESVKMLEECEGIEIRRFTDKGHFTRRGMGTVAFPELLEEVLQ